MTPPDVIARVCLSDLERVHQADQPYTRYFSWHGVPAPLRANWRILARWWLMQLTTAPAYVPPREFYAGDELVWAVDLRSYRWNAAAWHALTARDNLFRQGYVDDLTADRLRQLIGVKQDAGTLHSEAILWWPRVWRDSMETDRAPTYYDLLFANQRYPGGGVQREAYTVDEVHEHRGGPYTAPDGKQYANLAPGRYRVTVTKYREKAVAAQFVDFPRNEDDWNEFFGVKDATAFLKKQQIHLNHGAVVAGSSDDPVKGSIVARNNRVVIIKPTVLGASFETIDTDTTSGDTDFSEKHPEIAVGKVKRKAGELLSPLPAGGQAGLLINGDGKRIETAGLNFAHNRQDPDYGDVRTVMGCVMCHQPDDGFIMPRDLTVETLRKGIEIRIKDREVRDRTLAFFLDWDEKVVGWRANYARLRNRATNEGADPKGKGWLPAQVNREFLAFRRWYDSPVPPEQSAREVGIPMPVLKLMVLDSRRNRLNDLAAGFAQPRKTWDVDLVPDVMLRYVDVRDGKPIDYR